MIDHANKSFHRELPFWFHLGPYASAAWYAFVFAMAAIGISTILNLALNYVDIDRTENISTARRDCAPVRQKLEEPAKLSLLRSTGSKQRIDSD